MARDRRHAQPAALFGFALVVTACVDVGTYACARDRECGRVSNGFCHPEGYCAYPDPGCPAGARFSRLAGALANTCTERPGPGGSSGTGSSGTGTTSAGSSAGASVCGDGERVAPEACDDGNMRDGDGCNADCRRSGELLWSVTAAGDEGDDAGRGVVALAGGGLAVVGTLSAGDGTSRLWAARYDDEGAQRWSWMHSEVEGTGYAIARFHTGDLFITGEQVVDAGSAPTTTAWLGRLTVEGDLVAELPVAGTEAKALALFQGRIVVAGRTASAMFVEAFRGSGASVWRSEAPAQTQQFAFGVAATGLEEAWIAGRRGTDVWVARAGPNQLATVVQHDGPVAGVDSGQAILVRDESVYVGGFVGTEQAGDAAVFAFSPAGVLRWTWTAPVPSAPVLEEVEAMAFDADGQLVVVGFAVAEDRDAFIARIHPGTGTEHWYRSYPELGGQNIARGVAIAPAGTIYVVGEQTGTDGTLDAWVAAFAP